MKTICVIAPSSRGEISPADIAVLEANGYKVAVHPQTALADNQSAGSAQDRAKAVMDAFTNPAYDIVMAARGGNRAMHILPYLDFAAIKASGKPFIAFSDGTALLNATYARTCVTGYHGPTLSRVSKSRTEEITQMLDCLEGRGNRVELTGATTLQGGQAKGAMVGGNLSVFAALLGTPYMPDCAGKIVYLEDIGDQLSRYDRMLAQLRLAGVFDKAAAVMFGVMHAEGDSSVTPFGFTTADILREHTAQLNVPVLCDVPFGHKGPLPTFPVGGRATLDADAKTLTIE
ncbi:MAG: LD-carboxypeptidase [Alphaproteobacteria bacterium]|nr:LD-carboxypeptidase [Alphaproteobacteria bacterium]